MYGDIIVQSDLEAFKANIPANETVLAEWILKSLRKGRLIHSHHVGNTYLLIVTDESLYMLKLVQKKIKDHKKYSLLDFTNIQVGYLSKTEDALDECEENPGLYSIRFHFGPKEHKTFKHPSVGIADDAQKALIQVILSTIKATRRELYHSRPHGSAPLPVPSKQPSPSPSPNPSPSSGSFKQDSFMINLECHLLSSDDSHDPLEGVVTITQKHFVFEPSVGSSSVELMDSITIPLYKVADCCILPDDDVTPDMREFVMKRGAKVLQLFVDGKKLCFPIPNAHSESTRWRMSQWIQNAQDRLAAELISMTTIEHPLLSKDDTTTNFKGDSDIMSAKDVLYLQYKMPERHSMEKWELVYSTARHGISINTFYTKVANRGPSLIIVEDTNHHVFGGYASEPWVKTKQVHYGSGECFLFKLKPVSKVFKWTKLNDYFMYSKPDFISMGSGGGGYGLWLDADFDQGSSASSDTYSNEQLSMEEQFEILKVEVWAPPVFFQKKVPRPL